jgi:hypothetical protein
MMRAVMTRCLAFLLVAVAASGCGDDSAPSDAGVILDQSVRLDGQALPTATMLAAAQTFTSCLAVDSTSLYYTQPSAASGGDLGATSDVMQLPLAGGQPTRLASGADSPGCVLVDGNNAYFTGGDTLYAVPLGGSTPMPLARNQHFLPLRTPRLAVGGGYVYWVTDVYGNTDAYSGKNAIVRVPVGAGPVETLFSDVVGPPGDLAVDAHNVYYSDESGLYTRPLAGGTAGPIGMSAIHGNRFAVDGMHIALVEVNGPGMGDVAVAKLDGSGRVVVADALASSLALDGSGVYGNLDGHLVRFALDTKRTTQLTASAPRAIALDSANVYFADGAAILKIQK